jgi:hypothetical protein
VTSTARAPEVDRLPAVPPAPNLRPDVAPPLTPAEREFVRWLAREALKSWAP